MADIQASQCAPTIMCRSASVGARAMAIETLLGALKVKST